MRKESLSGSISLEAGKNGRGVGRERRREKEMPKHEVVTLV